MGICGGTCWRLSEEKAGPALKRKPPVGTLASMWLCPRLTYGQGECVISPLFHAARGSEREKMALPGGVGGAGTIDGQVGYWSVGCDKEIFPEISDLDLHCPILATRGHLNLNELRVNKISVSRLHVSHISRVQ